MTELSPSAWKETTARLAGARQTLSLLKSQIADGEIDAAYWAERLGEIGQLLDTLVSEREGTDHQRRLAALYMVSQTLGSSLEVEKVLNQVMDSIILLTGAERGFLLLFSDEDGELEVRVARNLERESLAEEAFALSRSVIQLVAETGEQVVTTNASDDPRFAEQSSVITHGLRSIQCVPMYAHGKTIGVVYVDNRIREGVFDEADLNMLVAFANQAAMAIENARLFTRTDAALEQRVEELQMLQEIDRQLNEMLDFERVMGLTLEWATRVTGADNGAIALIDVEAGETQIIARQGKTPADASAILSTGEVVSGEGTLTVPIQREGHVIGVIALDRTDRRPFDLDEQSFVLRMADHAAISIENARLYNEVTRANTAKNEFVSVMTHELRIPMTSIKGYAEMMMMIGELSEQQKGFLDIILNNVKRMSILVSDLSDVNRIEGGRLSIEMEDGIQIQQVLDEVLASLRADIDAREQELVVDIPDKLPTLRADPQRLGQILGNLISNANKYTPEKGKITVTARHKKGFIWVDVQDSGVGMSEDDLQHLFTKFWRSEDRWVREQPGTGLGLTIVKNLVEIHGGEMLVTSKPGEGSTFTFSLSVKGTK